MNPVMKKIMLLKQRSCEDEVQVPDPPPGIWKNNKNLRLVVIYKVMDTFLKEIWVSELDSYMQNDNNKNNNF